MSLTAKPRLFFLFHGRYPSEKAAALFLESEVRSFQELGYDTRIIAPFRFGRTSAVTKENIVYVPTIDLVPLKFFQAFFFRVSLIVFAWSALVYLLIHARRRDLVISNEALPLLVATIWFPNSLFELHDYPERSLSLYRLLFDRVTHILVTNQWKLKRFAEDFPSAVHKAFYEPNAVDISAYPASLTRKEARRRLDLPFDARLVVYTGHLYAWKGVDTLGDAAQKIPQYSVYVVGGTDEDVMRFKEKFHDVSNLVVVGRRPHEEMPLWQRAADVLVLPNTAKEEISAHYTSPMKLFEYLASGTPIVASDIPSIREVVGDEEAEFVGPDSSSALARGVEDIFNRADLRGRSSQWVLDHTWARRAERIDRLIVQEDKS